MSPHRVTREQIMAAAEALGIATDDLRSLTITPHLVTVEAFLRDDSGQLLTGTNGPAMQRTELPVVDDGWQVPHQTLTGATVGD